MCLYVNELCCDWLIAACRYSGWNEVYTFSLCVMQAFCGLNARVFQSFLCHGPPNMMFSYCLKYIVKAAVILLCIRPIYTVRKY